MVQKKENTGTGSVKMADGVGVTQQNAPTQGVNKLSTPDPNYASVKPQERETWDVDTRGFAQKFVDDVIKPYGQEDIKEGKVSDVIKISPEIRPQNTFEETAGGWNYDYNRNVNQETNQQGSLNALQGSGHVAGIPEQTTFASIQPKPKGRNISEALLPTTGTLEKVDVSGSPQDAASNTGMGGGFNGATGVNNGAATTQNQRQLKNADINFSQYGDDSSAPNQATRGGENEKYTGDFVKNSNLGYDPNIRTSDLDPNYMFGMDAQWANTDSAGYIARRNDMIASALFNDAVADGRLPTKDDVINYLAQQEGWMNSTEADRFNTIESIWKRLGGLANQTQQGPDMSNIPATYSDEALNNMENDLNQSTAGELYGKVTADQSTHITTLEDDNSVYKSMNEARIQTYKELRGMDSQAIAASIVSGVMASDSQALRDLMQYDPDKYQYVMQAVKQIRGQQNINSITSGSGEWSSSVTNGSSSIQNEKADFAMGNATSSTNTADILKSVNSTLNSNDVASTASEQMASIENDMFNLQNRLKNLKREANTVFKGDVPQYIVNAYMANRTQEIQDQLGVLENRYNAAYSRYQNEWEKTKWEAEFDLKKQELEIKKQSAALDEWSTRQGIALKWADLNGTINGSTPLSTLSVQEAINTLSDFSSSYATGSHGGQCGEFVKKYLAQIGVNLPNMSSLASKQSLIDSSITEPNQGDIVIMSSSNYPENGHMAIVEGVDDDGTIHLLESNWGGDENVHRRTISPNDKKILGYYRPTASGANAGANTSGSFIRKDGTSIPTAGTRYDNLTLDEQKTVEGLINKQVNPAGLNTRYGEKKGALLKTIAAEIDPDYTDGAFATANKTRDAWSTSTSKGSNSRNGTAVATAKELYEMADKIGNTRFRDWNSMVNFFKNKMSDAQYIKFVAGLNTLAFEYAGALKGGASPTEQDVRDAKQYITDDLGAGAAKTTAMTLTQMLYNKNVNEAQNYFKYTYEKAPSIWDDDVEEWMMNVVGLNLRDDYELKSKNTTGWYAMGQYGNNTSSNLSNDEMVYNIFSY